MTSALKRIYCDIDTEVDHKLRIRAIEQNMTRKQYLEHLINQDIKPAAKRSSAKKTTAKRATKKRSKR